MRGFDYCISKEHKAVLRELNRYFYYHQYADKYPHFRCADLEEEYDDEGFRYTYVNYLYDGCSYLISTDKN